MNKLYGWIKKGTSLNKFVQVNPIKYSLLMAISNKKIVSYKIQNKNINFKSFKEFITELKN